MSDPNAVTPRRRPKCKLIGADSNIFNVIGLAGRALRRAGQADAATEMTKRCVDSHNYKDALAIITEYVEPI